MTGVLVVARRGLDMFDIYATPILLGCTVFVLLRGITGTFAYAGFAGAAAAFTLRALAIRYHLQIPAWLTHRA
ncbi:MAG TPA: hypothetical protein VMN81_06730 [Vicinamibacterales bacterium]|nr:hypothetical protein [Vicinamibacterales bacterium]